MRAQHQRQNQPERVLQLNEEADKLDLTKVEPNEVIKEEIDCRKKLGEAGF